MFKLNKNRDWRKERERGRQGEGERWEVSGDGVCSCSLIYWNTCQKKNLFCSFESAGLPQVNLLKYTTPALARQLRLWNNVCLIFV